MYSNFVPLVGFSKPLRVQGNTMNSHLRQGQLECTFATMPEAHAAARDTMAPLIAITTASKPAADVYWWHGSLLLFLFLFNWKVLLD